MLSTEMKMLSKELGNPSIQKLIFIFTIHDVLSVTDLIKLTELSESQLHLSIKKMLNIKIIKKLSRGLYTLADDQFMIGLKKAYKMKIIDEVNKEISNIWNLLKKNDLEKGFDSIKQMTDIYGPLLDTHFSYQMNSLSHEFLDKQIQL